LDGDFVACNAYGNRYWRTMYLIERADIEVGLNRRVATRPAASPPS
jgi:hypothetical protein